MGTGKITVIANLLEGMRIHLRIGIAAAFASVMIPLTLGMVGYLYHNNANLALETATQSMTKASEAIVQDVDNLLNPAARVVEAASVLMRIDRGALRRPDGLRYFYEQMEKLPQIYSLFIGFGADGSFYQVIRLPESLKSFGPSARPVPEGARHALRLLDGSSGDWSDSFIFLGQWGDVRGVDRGPGKFDPRVRPWYKSAWEDSATRISDVYTFASTGQPGLTVSKRAATESGVEIGAIGADITLDALSGFLAQKKIGQEGRVFILDGQGRLIGHQNPELAVRMKDGKVELLKAVDVADPIVADSARLRETGLGERFTAALGPDGQDYMVSFTPFPKAFGKDWVIGIAVKELEFIGPLRQASLRILAAGILGIILAALAINWLARLLTRPLQQIVGETERIQRFELEGDAAVRTRIIEVDELSVAVQNMKRSLRSFSVYVPKDLVRLILSSGKELQTGGERRLLAIMFSDIKGFTQNAETMPPEQVLESLSEYFKHMSQAIHSHKGIIDKFIGDAIMAIWNAPQPDPDPMGNACRAVLACKAAGARLEAEFARRNWPSFFTRFGLHAGEVVVGNVGSQDRMQYTALGAEVNLASRLEALNKLYGTQLLVSETVASKLHDRFLFRMIDHVVPAGMSRPFAIFELVGELEPGSAFAATDEDKERCQQWEKAFNSYAAHQWDQAWDGFRGFEKAYPDDGPVRVFIARCKGYSMQPPPADWDTAQRLDHK
ncbi:MAG: adenylate/guanylate cyclase domain-containing protein [Rhodospirillales bacterium]|jgi:adenylate cyclase|nr:adenylate/guanylate cyclase domain-containing protein [Rhodospirillales bacterium]